MTKNNQNSKTKQTSGFSVPLGLVDYINPLLYAITAITITVNYMSTSAGKLWCILFAIGAAISLIFGFTIPTIKLLVGLGRMEFAMPVNIVFYVNTGIFISGITLFKVILNIRFPLFALIIAATAFILFMLYRKTKKFNTAAVLTGAVGYLLIYVSLILLSIRNNVLMAIILYALAICIFVFLCGIGIKADLKNAKIHWVIEISNIICQFSVALGTVLLLR